jgi:hypothetical protein
VPIDWVTDGGDGHDPLVRPEFDELRRLAWVEESRHPAGAQSERGSLEDDAFPDIAQMSKGRSIARRARHEYENRRSSVDLAVRAEEPAEDVDSGLGHEHGAGIRPRPEFVTHEPKQVECGTFQRHAIVRAP